MLTDKDVSLIRESEFPVTREWIYLNHLVRSPLPNSVVQAVNSYLSDRNLNGIIHGESWFKTVEEARGLAAQLINSHVDEIGFIKNTAEGICHIANGIDWHEGDNVITFNREYPCNVYPWMNLKDKEVDLRFVNAMDGRIKGDDLKDLIDEQTRVVNMSFVQFNNGFRGNLMEIGDICRERGTIFLVDGTQGVGALRLDIKEANIDALAVEGRKWLFVPDGTGFLYCSKGLLGRIRVTEVGASSVINARDFLNYDLTLLPDARRFESGILNIAGIYGLKAALKLILDIGIGAIEDRILMLTDHLCQGLEDKGYQLLSPRGDGEKSGIVAFINDKSPNHILEKRLRDNRIFVSVKEDMVKASPHFYNTEEEIERLIEVLP
ncbi:MAG: aminotransferase class V-fold PLP-dependent enzyme [Nitrospinae bacterium]|nr:aminotransferase class V-fold PLP-dependent enzyme [Nitrospinota bacterium]